MIIFEKQTKPFIVRMATALIQDLFFYLPILIVIISALVEKSLSVYSVYFFLTLFSIAVIRSIFVSKIAIQQITASEIEIELSYLRFDKPVVMEIEKVQLTFLNIQGYKGSLQRIHFITNSNKKFTQYFVGHFNTAEFDLLNSKLSEIGIRKPYGYNL